MRLAFVANLDAELELMRPASYAPSTRMRADVRTRAATIRDQLAAGLRASVEIVHDAAQPSSGPFAATLCWCPTPRALALARSIGAPPPAAPPLDVLQRVNHRAFAAALSPTLPGAHFVRSLADLDAILAAPRPAGGHLLKRPFGFAGRARKWLPPEAPLAGAARTWAAASMNDYGEGLQVEPRVAVVAEFAQHGIVGRSGRVHLGTPTVQLVDDTGAWQRSAKVGPDDLAAPELAALRAAANTVTTALVAAGYFGPFGIDAYRYRDASGALAFHPLSELNARLSMGFCVGMGDDLSCLLDA